MAGAGPESTIYHHTLSGGCSAHDAPKTRKPRTTKKDQAAKPSNSPQKLNDWAGMFDG